MSSTLFRLAYISRNEGLHGEAALAALLAVSRRNNARVGVTGAMLFSERCFAQVLEGPLPAVAEVFERIQRDERHNDVTILLSEESAERRFADWAMAYAGEDQDAHARFARMDFTALQGNAGNGAGILTLLDNAVLRHAASLT